MPLDRGEFNDVIGPFVEAMKYKLQNSKRFAGTRSWEGTSVEDLFSYLEAEVAELREAMTEGAAIEAAFEAVDIANLAMMVADRLGMRFMRRPIVSIIPTAALQMQEPPLRTGECPSRGGLVCRRYYEGDSACTSFGGRAKCLQLLPGRPCPHGFANSSYCSQCHVAS